MKHKHVNQLFCLAACLVLLGCAPARLTVSVDYFRFTAVNSAGMDLEHRIRNFQKREQEVEQDVSAMFEQLRAAHEALFKARQADSTMLPRGKQGAKEFREASLDEAKKLEAELQQEFSATRKELFLALDNATKMKQDRAKYGATADALLTSARQRMAKVKDLLDNEWKPQLEGDRTPRRLGIRSFLDNSQTYEIPGQPPTAALQAFNRAEAQANKGISQADKLSTSANGQDISLNPDRVQDDSDPFYNILSDPSYKPAWSTNFFIQKADSQGKVSFIIVRETPVRFSVNEAKTDPAVLIKTQLRSARAGIQTVANIAQALNPALPIPKLPKSSGETAAPDKPGKPDEARALTPAEEERRYQVLLLEKKLQAFATNLNAIRTNYAALELEHTNATNTLGKAEKVLKDAQTVSEKAKGRVDAANAAFKQALEAYRPKFEAVTNAVRIKGEAQAKLNSATIAESKAKAIFDAATTNKTVAAAAAKDAGDRWKAIPGDEANKDAKMKAQVALEMANMTLAAANEALTKAKADHETTAKTAMVEAKALQDAAVKLEATLLEAAPFKVKYDAALTELDDARMADKVAMIELNKAVEEVKSANERVQHAGKALADAVQPDKWADARFKDEIKPSLEAYRTNLEKLLESSGAK